METKPLDPDFGLETSAVDVSSPLSTGEFAELKQTFFRGQILVLRNQRLTPQQYLAFARRFGPPEPHVIDQFHHPEESNILILSNRRKDGQPVGLADAGTYFHTDYSYLQVPARATMLYSIEVPKAGGHTLFANQYAAYDDLSDAMKRRIAPLIGVHHYGNRKVADEMSRVAASPLTDEQKAKMPLITHPLVRPHPVTGRRRCTRYRASSYRHRRDAGRRSRCAARRARGARDATEIRDQLPVPRRRRRDLGQRIAAAFGDPDRSGRSANAVADHDQGAIDQARCAGSPGADVRGPNDVTIRGCAARSRRSRIGLRAECLGR
jgi:taurine dioxygenase